MTSNFQFKDDIKLCSIFESDKKSKTQHRFGLWCFEKIEPKAPRVSLKAKRAKDLLDKIKYKPMMDPTSMSTKQKLSQFHHAYSQLKYDLRTRTFIKNIDAYLLVAGFNYMKDLPVFITKSSVLASLYLAIRMFCITFNPF